MQVLPCRNPTYVRLLIFCWIAGAASGAEGLVQAFGHQWRLPIAADWSLHRGDGPETLRLLVPRPSLQPRRPTQFALADTPAFHKVTVEAEVRKEPAEARNRRTSLIIVYGYRHADDFNYAHLSVDTGREAPHHNGIFQVRGGDRVRISSLEGPATLTGEHWHKVKLVFDGSSGRVDVWVDGATSPSMHAADPSSGAGRVGLGSFFDLGEFRAVKISGQTAP